jgi:hypothetical protein
MVVMVDFIDFLKKMLKTKEKSSNDSVPFAAEMSKTQTKP